MGGGYIKKERNSNLELLRIITMLLIVAHHFVVNSGVSECYDFSNITPNMIFLQMWGMWGKTAINVFVMITGYFMCTSKLTVNRYTSVYLEAKFYKIVIFIILLVVGYQTLNAKDILNLFFGYWRNAGNGFTASFLLFYLFIPFYNVVIKNINKRQMQCLIGIAVMYFTIGGTFLFSESVFYEPIWYIVIYFIAAYIRLYPAEWLSKNKVCVSVLATTALLSYASILVVDYVGVRFGFKSTYWMVSDSHHLFALIIGVFLFLVFKNIKIKNSTLINQIASTTFGVFCIHTSSDAMRTFLWKDLLDVSGHFNMSLGSLIFFSIASAICVFVVCSLIDLIRIRFIERPVFNWLNKKKWFSKELY